MTQPAGATNKPSNGSNSNSWETFFQHLPNGHILVERDMQFFALNRFALKFLDYFNINKSLTPNSIFSLQEISFQNTLHIYTSNAFGGTKGLIEQKVCDFMGNEFWYEIEFQHLPNTVFQKDLVHIIINDITKRKRRELELVQYSEFEKLLSSVSYKLISTPASKLNPTIVNCLQELGKYAHANFVFIAQMNRMTLKYAVVLYWAEAGFEQDANNISFISHFEAPWYFNEIVTNKFISFNSLNDIPENATIEKNLFRNTKIASHCAALLESEGKPIGLLGLVSFRNNKVWKDTEISSLKILASAYAAAMERQNAFLTMELKSDKLAII